MSDIVNGIKEVLAITKGDKTAARIHWNGHAYVPLAEYEALRARVAELEEGLRYIAWEQKEGDQPHLIARALIAKTGETQ